MYSPVRLTLYNGRIDSLWQDDIAVWTGEYTPHPNPEYEALQIERRKKNLMQNFKRFRLFDPTIELLSLTLDTEEVPEPTDMRIRQTRMLRVSTYLMPYIDPVYLQPIFELRQQAPSAEYVHKNLVEYRLRAGGEAVSHAFGSGMQNTPSPAQLLAKL